jgi:hypothetical protein
MALATTARFPGVAGAAGFYESYFLKASHPRGGVAVWIRYTVHKRPGAGLKSFVWFTLFDAVAGVAASKMQGPEPESDGGAYIRVGESSLGPGRIVGRAQSAQLDATWELEYQGVEMPVLHLPRRWMYRRAFPRTKVLTVHPAVSVRGSLTAGERTIVLDGWPGTIGHNWGHEHARRAIWIQGEGSAGRARAWLDLALARVRLAGLTTPWIANGVLSVDGERLRLGGTGHLRSTRVHETPACCRFLLTGGRRGHAIAVEGAVGAEQRKFVAWIYTQPDGSERQTVNCSIADLRVALRRRAGPGASSPVLDVRAGAAYELQMAERYPPIPIQPFADG